MARETPHEWDVDVLAAWPKPQPSDFELAIIDDKREEREQRRESFGAWPKFVCPVLERNHVDPVANHHHKRIIARQYRQVLKGGFRALKEHHLRYIPFLLGIIPALEAGFTVGLRICRPLTNTKLKAKSYSSMLFSTNSLFREGRGLSHRRNPSAEWRAWFPQIFHIGHALHSPFRILEIINTLSTLSVSKWYTSVDSCRRSRLNRVCRFCRFDRLFLLSNRINNSAVSSRPRLYNL